MLDGRMRHRDNHGNEGLLVPGSVQWMTAGRGLVHSEMPEQEEGRMRGFQLWVNLPARDKMVEPRYQEFAPDRIPLVRPADGVEVRVIAGEVTSADGTRVRGPIDQPATSPLYLDVSLAPGAAWEHRLPEGQSAFAYMFEGGACLGCGDEARQLASHELGILGGGDLLRVEAGEAGARLLLVSGRPLREAVVRHGPFVMNTKQEIMQAFVDFQEGRF
ncbi:hypothetical protein GCM10011394_21320 [Luteimonas terricola]|uniref:Pirin family protein n=2 Tax=Luteimonas terricola TaxID=645597 RepID=A0ABQ2EHR4_9GAMM|nr:hypothetical protein GCM10011394_21320 [Luteimonas terricola]